MDKKILIVEDEFIIADTLSNMLQKAGYKVCGIADTVAEALDMIRGERPSFVLIDIYLIGKLTGIDLANLLTEMDIPFIYISANSNQKILEAAKKTNPYGFVIKPFREKDVLVALEIAIYRRGNTLENGLRQNAVLQKVAAQIISSGADWKQKVLNMGKALQPYIPYEFMSVGIRPKDGTAYNDVSFLRLGYEEYQIIGPAEMAVITNIKPAELSKINQHNQSEEIATWYEHEEFAELLKLSGIKRLIAETFNMNSHLVIPLHLKSGKTFHIYFYSRRKDAYNPDHLVLSNRYQQLLTDFAESLLKEKNNPLATKGSIPDAPDPRVAKQSLNPNFFEGIIGNSHLLLNVFDNVIQVAPADSSVLILGESGTGKEKIADRIHFLSPRKNRPFVKVNCAALQTNLIDSELFGHEKGSFTGAYERKIGRFEQAHTGTIFLDEIGEIPLEIQVKLLRVLQEKEIERIGGRVTIKTDVRVVAATNRNLEKEVAEGRFRLDLYYRLNVFPIAMPPLRDRKEDIPALAAHFLLYYSKKTGKTIKPLSDKVLDSLNGHDWPGNIRELENLIERNVLLTKDDEIHCISLPNSPVIQSSAPIPARPIATMIENERQHILAALKKCNGKIWGEGGAADLLNLPPTTLNSKMKRLGIKKDFSLRSDSPGNW